LPIAFILINAELGKEDTVLALVRALPEVKEAYMVYGVDYSGYQGHGFLEDQAN
jgi:hypothetical protein